MSGPVTSADLRALRVFGGLGDAALERLAGAAQRRSLANSDTLYEQGGEARELFAVVKGRLGLRVSDGERWTTVQSVEAEDLLGWSALRENARWLTTARALGPADVIAIPLETILDVIEAGGPDARRLAQRLFGVGAAHLDAVRQQLQQPARDTVISGG
jgi:CRP-like cAMP-binding protein